MPTLSFDTAEYSAAGTVSTSARESLPDSPGSPITLLLELGCPLAVVGFVIAVIIDALNHPARRALAHVGQEIHRGLQPMADAA